MLQIEEIDALRRQNGIDDAELRGEIDGLRVGDHVRLTFLAGAGLPGPQTLRARITSIRGGRFRGRLADPPAGRGPLPLWEGMAVAFTAGQIHSVAPAGPPVTPVERAPRKRR